MYAVEASKLTKKYGSINAVSGLNLEIEQGELFALLGVNGAGKSTAIRLLTTLTKPDSGDALIEGRSVVNNPAAVRELIAVSPQETAVAPNLSVRENLELICGAHGLNRAESRARIAEISEKLNLGEITQRRAGKLSGGWQRRLSIAMALITRPRVLFLDEPTMGLDVIARSELWELIRALKGKITVILTTHYMEEAEALADRIGIMREGRLLALGTARELKDRAGRESFEEAFIAIVREA